MFISEIPVRCQSSSKPTEKTIQWVDHLNSRTTARDIITSIFAAADPTKYSLYIHVGRHKQLLGDSVRIYKVVASVNQQKSARRLLFEIRPKKVQKRVRFADEIVVQQIVRGRCLPGEELTGNLIETISRPTSTCQENRSCLKTCLKASSTSKRWVIIKSKISQIDILFLRSSLRIIPGNISPSSSESGISSSSSHDDMSAPNKVLETLV